jgi:hypothetical protein
MKNLEEIKNTLPKQKHDLSEEYRVEISPIFGTI